MRRPHLADAASRCRETQSSVRGNSGPRNTPRERPHPTLARRLRSAVLCSRPPCPDRRPCPTRHLLQGQAESHRLRESLEPSLPDPRRHGCSSLALWLCGGLVCTATKGPRQSPCRDGSFPALRPPPSARPQIAHLCAFPLSTAARSHPGLMARLLGGHLGPHGDVTCSPCSWLPCSLQASPLFLPSASASASHLHAPGRSRSRFSFSPLKHSS